MSRPAARDHVGVRTPQAFSDLHGLPHSARQAREWRVRDVSPQDRDLLGVHASLEFVVRQLPFATGSAPFRLLHVVPPLCRRLVGILTPKLLIELYRVPLAPAQPPLRFLYIVPPHRRVLGLQAPQLLIELYQVPLTAERTQFGFLRIVPPHRRVLGVQAYEFVSVRFVSQSTVESLRLVVLVVPLA